MLLQRAQELHLHLHRHLDRPQGGVHQQAVVDDRDRVVRRLGQEGRRRLGLDVGLDGIGVGRDAGPDCLGGTGGDARYWAYFRAPAGSTSFRYAAVGGGSSTVRDAATSD